MRWRLYAVIFCQYLIPIDIGMLLRYFLDRAPRDNRRRYNEHGAEKTDRKKQEEKEEQAIHRITSLIRFNFQPLRDPVSSDRQPLGRDRKLGVNIPYGWAQDSVSGRRCYLTLIIIHRLGCSTEIVRMQKIMQVTCLSPECMDDLATF